MLTLTFCATYFHRKQKISGYTTWVGVQSASLYDNFGKPGNYVIMTSLMTS